MIKENFSKEAVSQIKGEKLNELIAPFLQENKNFAVDFTGITRFASPFFNNSFAKLALIYGFNKINSIQKINISEIGLLTYQTSINNAFLLFEKPEYSEKINRIINKNVPKKDD